MLIKDSFSSKISCCIMMSSVWDPFLPQKCPFSGSWAARFRLLPQASRGIIGPDLCQKQ